MKNRPDTLSGPDFDDYLIWLYELYSEQVWSAGWLSGIENGVDDMFVQWLRGDGPESGERPPYQEKALPTLRKCWEEAMNE